MNRTASALRGRAAVFPMLLLALASSSWAAAGTSIDASGVGGGIDDRELREPGDSFAEGEKVWFWTRVTGGEPGELLSHVWLLEGEPVLSVELEVGGPRWRTWSGKTLHPGSVGGWAVEARDAEGNVLARAQFRCVPIPGTAAE